MYEDYEDYENVMHDLKNIPRWIHSVCYRLEQLGIYGVDDTLKEKANDMLRSLEAIQNEADMLEYLLSYEYEKKREEDEREAEREEMERLLQEKEIENSYFPSEESYASDDHYDSKIEHRKSRKAKLKKTKRGGTSLNKCIGKTASAYGKKMIHRYNRRKLEAYASNYYKHNDFSYSSILWSLL